MWTGNRKIISVAIVKMDSNPKDNMGTSSSIASSSQVRVLVHLTQYYDRQWLSNIMIKAGTFACKVCALPLN